MPELQERPAGRSYCPSGCHIAVFVPLCVVSVVSAVGIVVHIEVFNLFQFPGFVQFFPPFLAGGLVDDDMMPFFVVALIPVSAFFAFIL